MTFAVNNFDSLNSITLVSVWISGHPEIRRKSVIYSVPSQYKSYSTWNNQVIGLLQSNTASVDQKKLVAKYVEFIVRSELC